MLYNRLMDSSLNTKHCRDIRNSQKYDSHEHDRNDADIIISDHIDEDDSFSLWSCLHCTYQNTGESRKCMMCGAPNYSLFIKEENENEYALADFDITTNNRSKRNKKKRNNRRKKRGKQAMTTDFEDYWMGMKQSLDEHQTAAIRGRKHEERRAAIHGKFTKGLKLRAVVYYRYYLPFIRRDPQMVQHEHVDIETGSDHDLCIAYYAIKAEEMKLLNNNGNLISMTFDLRSFDKLKANRMIGNAMKQLNVTRSRAFGDIPPKDIQKFIDKIGQNAASQYIQSDADNNNEAGILYEKALNVSVVLTLEQCTEFAFIQNNVSMQGHERAVLCDVPMKLKNFKLSQCEMRIQDKTYTFISDLDDDAIFIPLVSCPFESVYKASVYPMTYRSLKNKTVKRMVSRLITMTMDREDAEDMGMGIPTEQELADNLRFRECHHPFYNLLPLSFKVSRLMMDYIPIRHVIKKILVPFVGYNQMHYLRMELDIKYQSESSHDLCFVDDELFMEQVEEQKEYIFDGTKEPDVIEKRDKNRMLLDVEGHEYIDSSEEEDEESTKSWLRDIFGHSDFDSDSDEW